MGYAYDEQKVSAILYQLIKGNMPEKAQQWLSDQLTQWQQNGSIQQFNLAFSAAPRFLGRGEVDTTEHHAILPATNSTIDRLFRMWWLLQLPVTDKTAYIRIIENLFLSAEMNEQVALYGALPLLAFPEAWKDRTAEGIRSNIGVVLEAIMLDNPYPAKYLSEPAWNQLVLKAFFTDKDVNRIIGLDARANAALAHTLIDLAHERWAAGRPVNPLTWRLVAPFINESNFADIERVWLSEQHVEREAAALACFGSSYAPARALLEKRPEVMGDLASAKLTWDTVAHRING